MQRGEYFWEKRKLDLEQNKNFVLNVPFLYSFMLTLWNVDSYYDFSCRILVTRKNKGSKTIEKFR